ncbi:MAG: hypothetical protein JO257_17130 [Deltaproteobacteria bacterium]|nr:hypothetical protein [Deltaproteobacteria bacterium]
MRRLLLIALLPACGLYFPNAEDDVQPLPDAATQPPVQPASYELVQTKSMAGEHTVAGVDSDGAGGIWIAYCDDADYYTPKNVWVTHLDATGAKLSEWMMNDHYEPVSGIAFAGNAVWLNYSASGTGNRWLRKLDAHTGATLGTFSTEDGISDIAYDAAHDQLVLSNYWNTVISLDGKTGGVVSRTTIAATSYSTQRGVALDRGNVWVDEAFDNKFFYVKTDGTVLATATAPALGTSTAASNQLQLSVDESGQLIVVSNNQIYWFSARKQ